MGEREGESVCERENEYSLGFAWVLITQAKGDPIHKVLAMNFVNDFTSRLDTGGVWAYQGDEVWDVPFTYVVVIFCWLQYYIVQHFFASSIEHILLVASLLFTSTW